MNAFVQVKERDPSMFDRLFGPFDSEDEARAFAEENFSKKVWTVTTSDGNSKKEWF